MSKLNSWPAQAPAAKPPAAWLDQWHVNPSLNKDYDCIDGLRGIAILLVVACHLLYVNPEAGTFTRFLGGIASAGAFGVTVFFALSGFLIASPFWKRKLKAGAQVVPPGYGWRRFWKICPPLWLSILLFAPFYFFWTHDPAFFKLGLLWLSGLPLVLPVNGDFNPVMWSLLVEVHFYLVLPVLFLCCKRLSTQFTLWTLFLLFLLVPTAWRWANAAHGVFCSVHPDINVHFPTGLSSFAFGVLLAGLENTGALKKSWARFGDGGLVLLALALPLCSWLELTHAVSFFLRVELIEWLVKLAAALLLCFVADSEHPRARLLSHPWLRWCGLISYEWYLFHQPIIQWMRDICGPAHGSLFRYVGTLGGALLLGLLLSAVVYKYFSLPILRRGRERHSVGKVPSVKPGRPRGEPLEEKVCVAKEG